MSEKRYVFYRKLKAFGASICFYICRIFPIKKNLVAVCTFEGKGGFCCNPKYIVQKLHRENPEYQFVWLVNRELLEEKVFPDYIRRVSNSLWSRAYWLSRSKVWIDNYRKPYGTVKRKGQLYINTWHGMGGFKSIGLWRGKAFSTMARLVSEHDSSMVDYFLSDSEFTRQYFPRGLVYNGEYLQVGAPRCDILIHGRETAREQFVKKYAAPNDAHFIIFAPTFREGSKNGKRSVYSEIWSIDFNRLLHNLAKRFGGEWYLVLRLHPQIAANSPRVLQEKVIDVSGEDDLYELLAAMDAMITDYSSCAMDAAMMHIPVFIYADDIAKYKADRGAFTWDITEDTRGRVGLNREAFHDMDVILPFSIAKDNEELEEDVLGFDAARYEADVKNYEAAIGLITEGTASAEVAKRIDRFVMGETI